MNDAVIGKLNDIAIRNRLARKMCSWCQEFLWTAVLLKRRLSGHPKKQNLEQGIDGIYTEDYLQDTIYWESVFSLSLAKVLIRYFNPHSVIDIGCGCGVYLKAFYELGIRDMVGYDGSNSSIKKSLVPGKIEVHDLREPLKLDRKFDLCLCIEVAEHLSYEYSDLLATTLTGLSDTIFFTAAPPGQGGIGHVNEQPRSFWIKIFKAKGFRFTESLTYQIRGELKTKDVISWIVNNLMIFKK